MKANTPNSNLWNVDELAHHLRCSTRHIDNLRQQGLPYIQVGRLVRFDPVEVFEFLKENSKEHGGRRHG